MSDQSKKVEGIANALRGAFSEPEKPWRDLRPDMQGCDEVRIATVPRYKTSGLSGDEWRISAKIQFLRKGHVLHEDSAGDVDWAIRLLYAKYIAANKDGKLGPFPGQDDLCDQEGCAAKAIVTYRKKNSGCSQCGKVQPVFRETHRRFCARHSTRGDCGLDDADDNYELIEGVTSQPTLDDESPAAFGGLIDLSKS